MRIFGKGKCKLIAIVRIFGMGKCKFIANFSVKMVTSLPSLSLSLCLSVSLSLSHRKYLTHNIGSASALPIIRILYALGTKLTGNVARVALPGAICEAEAMLLQQVPVISVTGSSTVFSEPAEPKRRGHHVPTTVKIT